jgi:hypothetical protein
MISLSLALAMRRLKTDKLADIEYRLYESLLPVGAGLSMQRDAQAK